MDKIQSWQQLHSESLAVLDLEANDKAINGNSAAIGEGNNG